MGVLSGLLDDSSGWSFPIFQYWSEIEEHYNTLSGARSNVSFWDNFFKHNEGYHWIHHRYPTIPFYRLPEAHAFLTPSGTDISQGFFDSIVKCHVLKLLHGPGIRPSGMAR